MEKVDSLNNIDGVSCLGVSLSDEIENDYFYSDNFFVKKTPKSKRYKFFGSWYQNILEFKNLSSFLDANNFDVALFSLFYPFYYSIICAGIKSLLW